MKNQQARSIRQQHKAAAQRKQWLQFGLIGLGVLLILGLLVVSFSQAAATAVSLARVGSPLSNFTLTDIHGQKVSLKDYQGQVVLVNAWATWCPPCRAEMPDLHTYYQAHQADGFVVLAVNAGDSQAEANDFAQSNDLTFPVLLDPNLLLLNGFGINSYPTSIVVGRDGKVKTIHVGMYTPEALETDITPLLAQ